GHRAARRRRSARAALAAHGARRDGPLPVVAAARPPRGGPPPAAPRREGGERVPRLVKVILRNPRREVDVDGKRRVKDLLSELGILPGTVLVIGDDVLEVRPVMSGGAGADA